VKRPGHAGEINVDKSSSHFLQNLRSLLSNYDDLIYISHSNMDPDAIGSIIGLAGIIKNFFPNKFKKKVFPNSISAQSKLFLKHLGVELEFIDELPNTNFLPVAVDLPDVKNIFDDKPHNNDTIKYTCENAVIIDHHAQTKDVCCQLKFVQPRFRSNCEIIYHLFTSANIPLTYPYNYALCGGILFDTGFLKFANNETIFAINSLLKTNVDLVAVREKLQATMDYSEKIARIKAAQRCRLHLIRSTIVASSHVSLYEASACRSLLALGVDIAIVLAEKKGKVRISTRQTEACFLKHGINLASIMTSIGKIIGGSGGGHPTAAAANGHENGKLAVKQIISKIKELLKT